MARHRTGSDDRVRNGTTHGLAAQAGQGSAQGLTTGQGRAQNIRTGQGREGQGTSARKCSKIGSVCVPTARDCVPKLDAVGM